MVQGAAGDDQQRQAAVDGDLRCGVDGAVPAAHPEHDGPVRGVAEGLAEVLGVIDDLRRGQLRAQDAGDVTASRVRVDHDDQPGAVLAYPGDGLGRHRPDRTRGSGTGGPDHPRGDRGQPAHREAGQHVARVVRPGVDAGEGHGAGGRGDRQGDGRRCLHRHRGGERRGRRRVAGGEGRRGRHAPAHPRRRDPGAPKRTTADELRQAGQLEKRAVPPEDLLSHDIGHRAGQSDRERPPQRGPPQPGLSRHREADRDAAPQEGMVGDARKTRQDIFETGQPGRGHRVEGALVQPVRSPQHWHATVYPRSVRDHAEDHSLAMHPTERR
jgi:hypothetical protein